MFERPLVTVGGLIVAPDGEILLVRSKKWKDLYSLPGGKVEWGETRDEAIIREIEEETGLKVKNPSFAIVQDCIFSQEFLEKKHFVMHDFIIHLENNDLKSQIKLNEEAYEFQWTLPSLALKLPLHRECRFLIEWYLNQLKRSYGILGISHYQIPCIVGVYSQERDREQTLIVDAKIKVDFLKGALSEQISDTVDYRQIADLCLELAKEKKYFLLETFALELLEECIERFGAVWAWVRIQKPSAIPSASSAYVEMEKYRK